MLLFRNPSLKNKRVASAAFSPCQAKGVGVAFGLPNALPRTKDDRFLWDGVASKCKSSVFGVGQYLGLF